MGLRTEDLDVGRGAGNSSSPTPIRRALRRGARCELSRHRPAFDVDFPESERFPKLKWLADVVTALAYTGLRISELAEMRWGDIDLQNRMLHLPDESGYANDPTLELQSTMSLQAAK